MDSIQKLAQEAKKAFVSSDPGFGRRLGKTLMRLSETPEDWVKDLVGKVANNPSDEWETHFIYEALDAIAKNPAEEAAYDLEGDGNLQALVAWVSADPEYREDFVDDAIEDGHDSFRELLDAAQYHEKRAVCFRVYRFLAEKAKEESEVE